MPVAKKIVQDNKPNAISPNLAVYACHPSQSAGRLFAENPPTYRTEFQRDRDRIIHSGAFRKLEYKTQVFVNHEGDYYRTRLTHTLEVAQITRTISRALGLDEDLAEAIALAHDLGHTPFGHAGEDALDVSMAEYGGFNHNDQTLRILTQLELRYAKFDGLNLTWETLEGVVKHNGPLQRKKLHTTIAAYNKKHDLWLGTFPSGEAQVAAIADDIAYGNHDIDDGLRAGLFTVDDIMVVPLWARAFNHVQRKYPKIDLDRQIHESIRDLMGLMISDIIAESRRQIQNLSPISSDDIRRHSKAVVHFSKSMQSDMVKLKSFLMARMYRHYKVNRMTSKARRVVRELFAHFMAEPECLPGDWAALFEGKNKTVRARVIADYIAGMTDRYALDEHRRLFDLNAKS